jgi:biopolymer transport protein TolR
LNRRRSYKVMSEINVTNLVDVVLVLLIIFMISAPLLQSGIDIQLPQTTYVDTEVSEGIVVTVMDKDSLGIFIGSGKADDVYAGPANFVKVLNEFLDRMGRNQPVYLRADKNVRWQYVVSVISKIREQGVSNLGIVTAPYEEQFAKNSK